MHYAIVKHGVISGVIKHDGKDKDVYDIYGKDVELLGPVDDDIGADWVGKTADEFKEGPVKGFGKKPAGKPGPQIIQIPDAVLQQAAQGPDTGDKYIIYADKGYRRADGVWTVEQAPKWGEAEYQTGRQKGPSSENSIPEAKSKLASVPGQSPGQPAKNPTFPPKDTFKPEEGTAGTSPRNPPKEQVVEVGKPVAPDSPGGAAGSSKAVPWVPPGAGNTIKTGDHVSISAVKKPNP